MLGMNEFEILGSIRSVEDDGSSQLFSIPPGLEQMLAIELNAVGVLFLF